MTREVSALLLVAVLFGIACEKSTRQSVLAVKGSPAEQDQVMIAAASSDLEVLARLIDRDHEIVNRKYPPFDQTALMRAAEKGQSESVRLMMDRGADPNLTDSSLGWAALHYAARNEKLEATEVLISRGADINQLAHHPGPYPGRLPRPGLTPLDLAAAHGAVETSKLLLEHGAKLDGNPPESARSALHNAVMGQYVSRDIYLRQNGLGEISFGNAEIIAMLLAAGASLSEPDFLGNQPIHMCVEHFAVDTLTYLLQNYGDDIDVNAEGAFGRTPLHIAVSATPQRSDATAAEQAREAVVVLLKDHGADVSRTTETHPSTAYEDALRDHNQFSEHLLSLLRPVDSPVNTSPRDAWMAFASSALSGDVPMMEAILERSPFLVHGGTSEEAISAIFSMAEAGHVEAVRLLVRHGADIDARNDTRFGWTPLHHAAWRNQTHVVKELIGLGSDPNLRSHKGTPYPDETPLDVAARFGAKDVVDLLLEEGVDLSGNTPGYYRRRAAKSQPDRPPHGPPA